jgi:hypothetical protein
MKLELWAILNIKSITYLRKNKQILTFSNPYAAKSYIKNIELDHKIYMVVKYD